MTENLINIKIDIPSDELVYFEHIKNIYIVFGIKRSGHHALIEWIRQSMEEPRYYYNNCLEFGAHPHYFAINFALNEEQFNPFTFTEKTAIRFKEPHTKKTLPKKINCAILSYEEKDFKEYTYENLVNFTKTFTNSYTNLIPVVCIRDPFNIMASKVRGAKDMPSLMMLSTINDMWKIYAKEYLFKKHYINGIGLNYNTWLFNNEYKKEKSIGLKLDTYVNEVNKLAICGHNSSYSKIKSGDYYAKNKEKFIYRWKGLPREHAIKLIVDKELMILCSSIYGKKFVYEILEHFKNG